jgi:hypothetical protein
MAKKTINNLNGGEVSPYLYAREDVDKLYNKSCLKMENFIPLPYGGATKRPALQTVITDMPSGEIKLIPFEFNVNETYVLVFCDRQIFVIKNDSVLRRPNVNLNTSRYKWTQSTRTASSPWYYCTLADGSDPELSGTEEVLINGNLVQMADNWDETPATARIANPSIIESPAGPNFNTLYIRSDFPPIDPDNKEEGYISLTSNENLRYTISSPYPEASLKDLKFVQSADVLFLVHPNYPPQTLKRFSDTNWVLSEHEQSFPPFNDLDNNTVQITANTTSGTVTLSSNQPYFDANMEGEYILFTQEREINEQRIAPTSPLSTFDISEAINVSNTNWSFETSGNWRGKLTLEKSVDNKLTFQNYINVIDTTGFTFENRKNGTAISPSPEGNNTFIRVRYEPYIQAGAPAEEANELRYVFQPENPTVQSMARIKEYLNDTSVKADLLSPLQSSLSDYNDWVLNKGYSKGAKVKQTSGFAQVTTGGGSAVTLDLSDDQVTLSERVVQYGFDGASESELDDIIDGFIHLAGTDTGGVGNELSTNIKPTSTSDYQWVDAGSNAYYLKSNTNRNERPYLPYPKKIVVNGSTTLTEVANLAAVQSTPNSFAYVSPPSGTTHYQDHLTIIARVQIDSSDVDLSDPSTFTNSFASLSHVIDETYLASVCSNGDYNQQQSFQIMHLSHRASTGSLSEKTFIMLLNNRQTTSYTTFTETYRDICFKGNAVYVLMDRRSNTYGLKAITHPTNSWARQAYRGRSGSHINPPVSDPVYQYLVRVESFSFTPLARSLGNSTIPFETEDISDHDYYDGEGRYVQIFNNNDFARALAYGNGTFLIAWSRESEYVGVLSGFAPTTGSFAFEKLGNNIETFDSNFNLVRNRTTSLILSGATYANGVFYSINKSDSNNFVKTLDSSGALINSITLPSSPSNPSGIFLFNKEAGQRLFIGDKQESGSGGGQLYEFVFEGEAAYYEATTEVSADTGDSFAVQLNRGDWMKRYPTMDRFQRGAFSTSQGYPAAVTLFENRLVYGGVTNNPDILYLSKTDDYGNFQIGSLDTDSMRLTLNSGQLDLIEWLMPHKDLIIGCSGSEWTLGSSSDSQPITPTSFSLKRRTTYGSTSLPAVLVNSAVLFFMRQQRKLRQWNFDYDSQDYTAEDLTIVSEHITESGVKDITYQQQPDNIIWVVRKDGQLIGLTYERDQKVIGWHRHLNDVKLYNGNSANFKFKSVTTTPRSQKEDAVYVAVEYDGAIATDANPDPQLYKGNYICLLKDREWGTDLNNYYGVDMCHEIKKPDGSAASYINDELRKLQIDHFMGVDVELSADGKPLVVGVDYDIYNYSNELQDRKVIYRLGDYYKIKDASLSGIKRLLIGLPFKSILAPLYVTYESRYGSTVGSKANINMSTLRFKDTVTAKVGQTIDKDANGKYKDLEDVKFENDSGLQSGTAEAYMSNASEYSQTVYVVSDKPVPCTVLAMTPHIDTGDR